MKTWSLKINEEELKALIDHHAAMHGTGDYEIERSARIHDLTKRLNKETPEIETDPRPDETRQPPVTQPEGWG